MSSNSGMQGGGGGGGAANAATNGQQPENEVGEAIRNSISVLGQYRN